MTSNWTNSTLGELSIGGRGYYGIGASAVPYSTELYTYLRITDINDDGTLNMSDLKSVSDEKATDYLLKPNDIVFARTGASTGRNYFYDGTDGEFVFAGFLIKFSLDPEKVNPRYIKYYCLSKEYRDWIAAFNTGSTRGNINAQTLASMPISLPDKTIQDRVVKVLDALEEKRKSNTKINDNLQQQAAAIFRSWFVDCIPFGGTVPDEWKNVTLEDITSLVSRGITPKYADDTDQIVINQKCIRNHMIDLSFARNHRPKVINNKWLRFGDLLINSTGDGTLGRAAQVWFQPHNLTVDSHVTIVRPAAENMIFYIGLWGTQHEKEIESLHTGSTGQTELPRDRVKAIELLLPDKETMDRFNALIAPMAAAIVSNQEENNRLASIRDALLPKLMSGRIDVSAIRL
ncbi:MAG TPA: restriction endonuclease subunit S [Candidatus Agathobaculum merdipullorum]|nr:restriction endonuclease subunit S [Candidatus Agathobaculum merdipullorum]